MAIPPHTIPSVIKGSGFVEGGQNWVGVDKFTLKTKYENVYAIGDVTEIKVDQRCRSQRRGYLPRARQGLFASKYWTISKKANQATQCLMERGFALWR